MHILKNGFVILSLLALPVYATEPASTFDSSTPATYHLLPSNDATGIKLEMSLGSRFAQGLDRLLGNEPTVRKLVICAAPSDALEVGLKTGDFEIVAAALKIMKEHQEQIDISICMNMIHDVLVWRIREYRILKWGLVIAGVAGALTSEKLAQEFDFFKDNLRAIQLSSVAGVGTLFLLFDHLQTALVFNCLNNLRAVLQYPHKTVESPDNIDKAKAAIEQLAKQATPTKLPKA